MEHEPKKFRSDELPALGSSFQIFKQFAKKTKYKLA